MPPKKESTDSLKQLEQQNNLKTTRKTQAASKPAKTIKQIPDIIEIKTLSEGCPAPQAQTFSYNGMDFVALEDANDGNGVLAISAAILEDRMRFSDSNDYGSNDWRKSSIRKKLNTEHIKKFNTNDLLPIVSDLTADTGEDDYGTCEDYIALPSDSIIRRFNKVIPSYNTWIWTITPWAVKYSNMSAVGARTQAKTIYSEQPNRELGVAIVCVFKKDAICI